MGLTVTEDTPADMLAGNMELLVQLPPRIDDDYDNDDIYDGDDDDRRHQHHRNHHRHHNHHHNNGHHQRRSSNSNARRVTVARSTPMMDLLVQVATSQKLSASSYTLEAIGEHGLVLTHHPNTPIGALDALQVKLLPKQGTFVPMKARHVNQPFESTFRLQVHLPRNQLYVSRVSSRMNLGKILDEVCREKNLDRNNYELCHPANIEETLDLSLSLQDYHLQEVTLCPKRRLLGSSLSSQDIMALQRQEERRRQDAKQSVFGFAFKKSKESSLSTDSLGERSVSPARSDGTGRSASPQAPTAPTRPQRKRRPAPKPPMIQAQSEPKPIVNGVKEIESETKADREEDRAERIIVISHSRNSSDSSGYHEASVLSDNLDSNIRVPETLPRRSKLQTPSQESPARTLAESSQASKSLGNLAAVAAPRTTIARGTSNSSLISAGLRKKKAAPAPPQPRPLSSAISTQALERIVDSDESLTSGLDSLNAKALSDVAVESKRNVIIPRTRLESNEEGPSGTSKIDKDVEISTERRESVVESPRPETDEVSSTDTSIPSPKNAEIAIIPNVEPASENKRAGLGVPVPKPRGTVGRLESVASSAPLKSQIIQSAPESHLTSLKPRELVQQSMSNSDYLESIPRFSALGKIADVKNSRHGAGDNHNRHSMKYDKNNVELPKPMPRSDKVETEKNHIKLTCDDVTEVPKKPRRKILENMEPAVKMKKEIDAKVGTELEERKNVEALSNSEKFPITEANKRSDEERAEEIHPRITRQQGFEDLVVKKIVASKISKMLESAHINDGKRSCTVISTIPKCDRFERPTTLRKVIPVADKDREKSGDEMPEYKTTNKIGSLGSSFGAGKLIMNSNYQLDLQSTIGALSSTSNITNIGSDDELKLEDLEMFEGSKNVPKLPNLLRSHSELNNFEINTIEGYGRHLISRSGDFTFALNPNLSRNITDLSTDAYPEKYLKRHLSLDDTRASGINSMDLPPPSTKVPVFRTSGIAAKRREYFQGAEDDTKRTAWTLGESGSGDESSTVSASPIAKTELTSNLLKKVSDTLSESSRSPAVAASSSLANEQDSLPPASSLDQSRPGDTRLGVNEPKHLLEVNENLGDTADLRNKKISTDPNESNFPNDHQPPIIKHSQDKTTSDSSQNTNSEENLSSTSTDWEYLLPEPPTAFRDTNVVENNEAFKSDPLPEIAIIEDVGKLNSDIISREKPASRFSETVKYKGIGMVLTNPVILGSNFHSEDEGLRSRTVSTTSSEIGSELAIERGRASRSGIKSGIDFESRRGSQASSTPRVAPVDNTLSNFVITTYSRPKNVDIFDDIEGRIRETEITISRKNSVANSVQESRTNSTSSNRDIIQPRIFVEEKSSEIITVQRTAQPDILTKENDLQVSSRSETLNGDSDLYNNVNRSNIKISIATKPRPRADTITENQRSRAVIVNNDQDDLKNSSQEIVGNAGKNISQDSSVVGGNQKFSQWRENILKKQETPTKEKQLQSLQVLRNILPQLEGSRQISDDSIVTEKANYNSSEGPIRVVASVTSNNDNVSTEVSLQQEALPATTSNEPRVKRYTYAGPPAIDLGSWSERPRTTRVQIKPDSDYKFEKSRTPEAGVIEPPTISKETYNNTVGKAAGPATVVLNNAKSDHPAFMVQNLTSTTIKNPRINSTRSEKKSTMDNDQDRKEPNELAKALIARTTASGFKRPFSMPVEPSGTTLWRKKEDEVTPKCNGERELQGRFNEGVITNVENGKDHIAVKNVENEVDARPLNFKELKQAFAKDEITNSLSKPKYGSYVQRTDNSNNKFPVRRDSNLSSKGMDPENVVPGAYHTLRREQQLTENARINKPIVSVQEKRNFVIPAVMNNRCSLQEGIDSAARRTSRTIMPVVKGFKISVAEDEAPALSQEKRAGYRVAIGDISNGNYVASHNGLRKTVQVKVEDSSSVVYKPLAMMPVITGVTLKSTNYKNARPKSIAVEPDSRNSLLESIRNFGGTSQLRHASRRNTNISGSPGSRFVRS